MKFSEGVGIYFHSNGRRRALRVGGKRGLYAKNVYEAAGGKQFALRNIISERVLEMTIIVLRYTVRIGQA